MIGNKDEFLTALKTLIGDNTDDNSLEVLEYANKIDTANETALNEANEKIKTLETEKANLDSEWRRRYKETFFNPSLANTNPAEGFTDDDVSRDTPQDENYPKEYKDLFTEVTDKKE